ncbi:glycoside hydrolase family 127 protein [Paenibacillus macerans]|uniref:glycoside hydrolase family 127 protein n=1 Tax=Paenibacillus macerans TaxID=44252 RepID=UPI00203C9FA8|nr:beta-L-arabinofuranosidase domain-containing protein [Paenibacillus macerans]MCM3699950.1 glycoside hydrolase family 127 protein [Paenibacillus macerans]
MSPHQLKMQSWRSVSFNQVGLADGYWGPRLEALSRVTLPACLAQCEATGRISNFAKAGGLESGEHQGMYYDDSDVYKVLEGAAYSLMIVRDERLEAEIDRIIDLIAAAQEEDGYLSTYYTLTAPDKKWTDMEKHEMYNGGHLLEAAVAYYEATGKLKLLDVACRLADHYDRLFGPGKRHWVEGHEEIELALVKLHRVTGEARYLKLARWLLEERGHGHGAGEIWEKEDWGQAYCQDDVPVREIRRVTGHAVRAMYLYTAMADVVGAAADSSYAEALQHVWAHTVERNMYVTGGIGPSRHNEGFTTDYDLPNESAYCETCAAIALVFWNHRMNLLYGDAKYADVVEKAMYNGVLSGISLSGDRFFYENPLASQGNHHRVEWFHTSCCPTNLARFLPSVGGYAYAVTDRGLACNLFMGGHAEITLESGNPVKLEMETGYPWDGGIRLTVHPGKDEEFPVLLRIPGWCRSYQVAVNGTQVRSADVTVHQGYLVLERKWTAGDLIEYRLDMSVQVVRSRPEVEANRGRIAFQRGPLVYCLEQEDNGDLTYDDFFVSAKTAFSAEHRDDILGGVTLIYGQDRTGARYTFIPYYAWENRKPGFMQVWVKEQDTPAIYNV